LRLAGPTTGLMVVQIFVAIADTYFIGRLGTDALAGLALVFPLTVLMQNIAAGGMGGGVASAMARALGAGRLDDAGALVVHALILGLAFALLFTVLAWTVAPWLYVLLGGSGLALERALTFSYVWFSGAAAVWVYFFLSALLRGGGDAVTPWRYGLLTSLAYVPLSGVLTLGIGGWPGLGVAGAAIAGLLATGAAALLLAWALWRGKLGFTPRLTGIRLERRLFAEILRVGVMGSATTLTANLTAMLATGLVGRFGVAALAGYSVGVRLEFMLAPLAFGIGSGLTTLVGVAAGARAWRRALRVAWTGGLIAFGTIGVLGWTVALWPRGLVAPVRFRAAGDCRQRLLHHACGPVLLPVRPRPDAQFCEPRRGPDDRPVGGRHRAHGNGDRRRLVRGREAGARARWPVRRNRGRHGRLWLPDCRAASYRTLGTQTPRGRCRNGFPRRREIGEQCRRARLNFRIASSLRASQ